NFNTADLQILLAVSGGMDSMVMADLFLKSGIPFGVAHCNFQLRGEESDGDEQLVKDWCAQNDVRFYSVRFDTEAKMKQWGKAVQETARILRYDWLEQIRKENNYTYLATAHHANDNAETLLMNLFKGTGIAGLHGIKPVSGTLIRPLLGITRADMETHALAHKVAYRDDSSNSSDKYLRNDVRLNIIPVIEKAFPNLIENLNNSITRFAEAEHLYSKSIENERKKLVEQRGKDFYIPVRKLMHRAPLSTIVYELFAPFGFSPAQTPHLIKLMSSESGHIIESDNHRVIKDREFLIVTGKRSDSSDMFVVNEFPATVDIGDRVLKLKFDNSIDHIPNDEQMAVLNANKIELPLVIRKWKQGDYFYPLGMGMKKKKVSRYLIDKKVPIHLKENVWVVESNKRILWIVGHRIDERFRLSENNDKTLIIS
ncbi:MAG: tRNA lysidine(34) synthetase TilS, partial [Chitinophagales bacterium]|nr:tRNA lysidine(34) synthetase TilS [Chitinophagales bacterium]